MKVRKKERDREGGGRDPISGGKEYPVKKATPTTENSIPGELRQDKWQTRPMGISLIRKLHGRKSLPVGFLLLAVELAIRLLQFIGKQFQVSR